MSNIEPSRQPLPRTDPACLSGSTPRDGRNRRRYTTLLAVWAALFLLGTWLVASQPDTASALVWSVVGLQSVAAILAALAYWHFLEHADELARAIELRALALSVCVGFVAWPLVELLARAGFAVHRWPNPTVLTMIACYCLAVTLGRRHYR